MTWLMAAVLVLAGVMVGMAVVMMREFGEVMNSIT